MPKTSRESLDFEIAFFEGILQRSPDYIEALIPLAEAYTVKGLYKKGLEMDRRLAQLCPEDATVYYNLACSYALLGHKGEAISELEQSIKLGYTDFTHLQKDSDLKSLYTEPGFQALLEKIKCP